MDYPPFLWALSCITFSTNLIYYTSLYIQRVLGRTSDLFFFIRHGTCRHRRVQNLLYFCLCIHCRVNVFTEPLHNNNGGYTQTDVRESWSMPLMWAKVSWCTHIKKMKRKKKRKKNSVALVRKQTIHAERPPLVGEVCANFCRYRVSRGQHNGSPWPLIPIFYTRSRYFSIKIVPQLS
jgi:hypothetical protein